MASTKLSVFLILALLAYSCMAQSPVGAPTVSPTATPTAAPTATPPTATPSIAPTPSSTPTASPASAPGAASPNSAGPTSGPTADLAPSGDGSNSGFVSRAAIGGTALAAALVAVALM